MRIVKYFIYLQLKSKAVNLITFKTSCSVAPEQSLVRLVKYFCRRVGTKKKKILRSVVRHGCWRNEIPIGNTISRSSEGQTAGYRNMRVVVVVR